MLEVIQSIGFTRDNCGAVRRVYLCYVGGGLFQISREEYNQEAAEDGTVVMPEVFLSRGTYGGMKYHMLTTLPLRKDRVT